jgi:hypothetical protein
MKRKDDDNLMNKILNPKTKQDIYDTIPNAREIFEGQSVKPQRSVAPVPVTPKYKYQQLRQERLQERKEMLTKRAKDHFNKMLEKRLAEIEKNCK